QTSRSTRAPPNSSRSAASAATASGSPTSHTCAEVSTGSDAAAACSRSSPRATSASRHCRVASRCASASPIPDEPPVITARGRVSGRDQGTPGPSPRVSGVTGPPAQPGVPVSTRPLLRLRAVGTAFVLLLWLLWTVRTVLQLLLGAGFLALALTPAVTWFE